ncbi:hypothetical protein LY13_004001 [Prauserella aidingensis]|uniref:hypothetical protein n=1 Tax=Prauserella aidingensis TaxID=387890 RepID=UPI0020A5781D|nr:hypothetical protein [Prauserella aidingensis]MCP2255227.1 hypothetical protein [Prauserella aidingensis]
MSTPENATPGQGCTAPQCEGCEAAMDAEDVFRYTRDLLFLALLTWVLHLATHDLSGGWTVWSYAVAAFLAACALRSLGRLAGPLDRSVVRGARALAYWTRKAVTRK